MNNADLSVWLSQLGILELGTAVRLLLILLLIFMLVVNVIIIRQVQLMNQTLATALGPLLKAIAIIYLGVVAATLVMVIGFL